MLSRSRPGGQIPDFRGVLVAPWPNRIPDGKYTFDGADYRVPVNEPGRDCALHGFTPELDWQLDSRTDSAVVLSCAIEPTPGYPFALALTATYSLDGDGLHATVMAPMWGIGRRPTGSVRTPTCWPDPRRWTNGAWKPPHGRSSR